MRYRVPAAWALAVLVALPPTACGQARSAEPADDPGEVAREWLDENGLSQ